MQAVAEAHKRSPWPALGAELLIARRRMGIR
ncbi:hypothetical protein BN381_330116 [Candidatus Microthrix parvicella RN1]|uniref:Uncharacterized protein n=1 Tax=Candidatus Neomicrothrix parvicella RN1 TaxID=1229780 RepID=R4Z499_9ACTN|nr:hypothetical protein BN381_330116 [Candidatus Microthrix parvicella RN1]